ncbi:MAG: hypothetical protein AABZ60_12435 [Planctomycetota bacterium]
MNVVYSPQSSSHGSVQPLSFHSFQTLFRRIVFSFPFFFVGIVLVAYESVLFFVSKLQVTSWSTLISEKIGVFQTIQTAESFFQSGVFNEVLYGVLAGLLITLLKFAHFRLYSPHRMTNVPDSFFSAIFCREIFTQGWKFFPLLLLNTSLGVLLSTAVSVMGATVPLVNNATPFVQLALGISYGGGPDGIPSLNVLSLILILFFTVILLGILISLALHMVICWPMILLSSLREATTSAVSEIYAGRGTASLPLGKRLFSALKQGAITGVFSGMIVGIFQSASIVVALSSWGGPFETLFLVLSVPWSLYFIFNTYMHPEKIKNSFKDLFEFLGKVFAVVFGCLLYFGIGGGVIYLINSC